MKLTVDSNVVVKWFITELLSDAARVLLTPRIDLYAPDILLTDCANTVWKKFHTNEIPDPQPYFDELENLPDIVTLLPGPDLTEPCGADRGGAGPSRLRLSLPGVFRGNGFGARHGRRAIRAGSHREALRCLAPGDADWPETGSWPQRQPRSSAATKSTSWSRPTRSLPVAKQDVADEPPAAAGGATCAGAPPVEDRSVDSRGLPTTPESCWTTSTTKSERTCSPSDGWRPAI